MDRIDQKLMTGLVIGQYKTMRTERNEAVERAATWKSSAFMGWGFFFIGQIAWVIRSLT